MRDVYCLDLLQPRLWVGGEQDSQVTLARLSLLKERGDSGMVPVWQHFEEFMQSYTIDDVPWVPATQICL